MSSCPAPAADNLLYTFANRPAPTAPSSAATSARRPASPPPRPNGAPCDSPGQRPGKEPLQYYRPNGAPCDSPGQRPGNSAPPNQTSPERARFHTAIPRPNPRTPPPRRTGRRGRPACEIYRQTRIPALTEEIRRRVCGTLGVGVARVSPFQGWVGWGALFPGRCPGLSPLAALRPTPIPLVHLTILTCCGQRRARWCTCSVLPRSDTGRRAKGRIMIAIPPSPQRGAMR